MSQSITFEQVVHRVLENKQFMREYDRLKGTTFSKGGIEHEIDVVTGRRDKDAKELFDFIVAVIWLPMHKPRV